MKKGMLIYQRIIIIQLISIVIIMALFSIYLYNTNLDREIKLMTIQAESIINRLSSNLSIPLWNYEKNTGKNIISQDIPNQYLFGIVVYENNKLWIGTIKTETGEIIEIDNIKKYQNILNNAYKTKKQNIIFEDEQGNVNELGEVEIYITDQFIQSALFNLMLQSIVQSLILVVVLSSVIFVVLRIFLNKPLKQIINTAARISEGEIDLKAEVAGPKEITTLALAFNSMTDQLKNKAEGFRKNNEILSEIINKSKEIIANLNSSSKEIESAVQEQTSGSNQQASGITEVSATLEELTITAKQITKNIGDLVYSSEEILKTLHENKDQLLKTVLQLEEVGKISLKNAKAIGELGKRSLLINEMVEIIKEVANKTNILSINASIEASRSDEAGKGFSVVAAEIRELSKETINSAKNVEKAAKEIQDFLNSIIMSSESESRKVIESVEIVKKTSNNIESIVDSINNNYSFTQKIDASIKQQESGSKQAADTIKQMAEISRQSAETARQILIVIKDIVALSEGLNQTVEKTKAEEVKFE
jgi:methyl-accepting chemotaxis protein